MTSGEPAHWRACSGCGLSITIVAGPNGKPIPLQRVRRLYRILESEGTAELVQVAGEVFEGEVFGISHFEGCPKASEFSRRGEQRKQAQRKGNG
jgi:hypothetical protein